ncbi:response regulator [Balneola sp. MJW-20]|uniref:response regulator n=1 Tax=Gracilimonas aurantiaca TaxID=3234185 RepID=UPI003465D807
MVTNKVMIVEDDKLLAIVEERLVKCLGYEVVGVASSGEEAIEKIDSFAPDILIMDVQLDGDMDGIDTVTELRNRNYNVPVIYISGDQSEEIKNRANNAGMVDFLLKPVSTNGLLEPLKQAQKMANKLSTFAA